MKPPRVRWNTTEARIERFVRLAQGLGLPVYGFEIRGRDVTVLTHPRSADTSVPVGTADAAENWFRNNGGSREPAPAQKRKRQ